MELLLFLLDKENWKDLNHGTSVNHQVFLDVYYMSKVNNFSQCIHLYLCASCSVTKRWMYLITIIEDERYEIRGKMPWRMVSEGKDFVELSNNKKKVDQGSKYPSQK